MTLATKKPRKTILKKIITLGDEVEPRVTLCPGHVTVKEFNMEMRKMGHGGKYKKFELKYEYWRRMSDHWNISNENDPLAAKVTAIYW